MSKLPFQRVIDAFADVGGVSYGGKGFGSSALKLDGKIFCMIDSQERFVAKLPRARVATLIDAGDGVPFTPTGRVMKEWVAVSTPPASWLALAKEAYRFAKGQK